MMEVEAKMIYALLKKHILNKMEMVLRLEESCGMLEMLIDEKILFSIKKVNHEILSYI